MRVGIADLDGALGDVEDRDGLWLGRHRGVHTRGTAPLTLRYFLSRFTRVLYRS